MLSRWQSTIVDAQGNVQPHARLVIYTESDQERATVYRDRDGTDEYPLGEVEADEWGYAYFYADPDVYRITSAPLAIDWREVVVAGEWLLVAEGNAAQSAAQALLSAQQSTASASAANVSKEAAEQAAIDADGSADQAGIRASDASASADAAQVAESVAVAKAGEASASASTAAQEASDAAGHAQDALGFSQDAEESKSLAEKWAQNPVNEPVLPDEYSAYHWAKVAESAAAGIPSGIITMWSGAINAIPSGWALCDGSNGTPDLRDRFVIAAGGSYAVGSTGDGSIPSHSHGAGTLATDSSGAHTHSASTGSAGAHSHSGSTNSTGAHTHQITAGTGVGGGNLNATASGGSLKSVTSAGAHSHSLSINANGAHTHTVSVASGGDHTHTVSGSTAAAGSGSEVIAKYYALAYIMKL